MEAGLGRADARRAAAVVGASVSLAEVIGLNLVAVGAQPLPVNLIKVIGLEDEAGDNANTRSSLDHSLDGTEEEVLGRGDGRRVGLGRNCEYSTQVGVVVESGAIGEGEVVAGALGEVNGHGAAKCRVSRTCCSCAVSKDPKAVICLEENIHWPLTGLHREEV